MKKRAWNSKDAQAPMGMCAVLNRSLSQGAMSGANVIDRGASSMHLVNPLFRDMHGKAVQFSFGSNNNFHSTIFARSGGVGA